VAGLPHASPAAMACVSYAGGVVSGVSGIVALVIAQAGALPPGETRMALLTAAASSLGGILCVVGPLALRYFAEREERRAREAREDTANRLNAAILRLNFLDHVVRKGFLGHHRRYLDELRKAVRLNRECIEENAQKFGFVPPEGFKKRLFDDPHFVEELTEFYALVEAVLTPAGFDPDAIPPPPASNHRSPGD
jgi:hypothetical protein